MSVKINFKKSYYRWLFGGIGFHNSEVSMTPMMSDEFLNERVIKTYREISPTFTRVFAGFSDWTKEAMDRFADYYHKTFAQNDCSIYMVPGRLPYHIYADDEKVREHAENVAKRLKYLIDEKDCRLIRYYCITNELSVGGVHARYAEDLDKFKRHMQMLFDAFLNYGLDNVGLISTDASGIENFDQIDWAIENMYEITDTFCTHHYLRDNCENDTELYHYFYDLMRGMVQKCKNAEKRYILGEFGLHNTWGQSDVMKPDVSDGFLDPVEEPKTALTACVKALAAMNAGVYSAVYWTMIDYPDPYISDDGHTPEARARHEAARFTGWGTDIRYNKNGLLHWTNDGDYNATPYMYSMGIMARFFRKNSSVLEFDSSDRNVVCGGTVNLEGNYSYCIINLSNEIQDIDFSTEYPVDKPFRGYTYNSHNVPYNEFGDLQQYDIAEADKNGALKLTLQPNSLVILTTDYEDRTPSEITDIVVTEDRISWPATEDSKHCYYRVFEDGIQIGSTVAEYLERKTKLGSVYTVKSVDKYMNV